MTVKELLSILHVAMSKGCGDLQVAATINPEASTSPDDLAYGDIGVSGPNFEGRVFGITAIKGAFPEALEPREIADAIRARLIVYNCDDCAKEIISPKRFGDLVLCDDCYPKELEMSRKGIGPYAR